MHRTKIRPCLLGALLLSPLLAWAQADATKAAAKPAPKASAKPAPKAAPKAAPEPALPPATPEQLQAAEMVLLGPYDCEFDQKVMVEPNAKHTGYVDVVQAKNHWTMKPVLSSTGALRLEDVKGRMLMIQVANKSMMLDTKIGQRLVDGCLHEKQKAYVKPADAPSLGIAPPAAGAASAAKP